MKPLGEAIEFNDAKSMRLIINAFGLSDV